ncbi:MAG: archaellin/type IV pilin N-terminal domain-containing protein [Nanoarchaeota archaeon]
MVLKQKKAEMGVGTLIVFIAMLLVAAVAAGVLIQTVGSLQEKSLATGQQARTQISTNARVIEVSATDGRAGNLSDFEQLMKLSPGSDPIKLDQVIFTFNTQNTSSTLKYREGANCSRNNETDEANNLTGYYTDQTTGEGFFTVIYEQEGSNHVPGNLQRGDIIRLCYAGVGNIGEDEMVRLNFIPRIGTPTLTQFATPDVITTQRVYLYP